MSFETRDVIAILSIFAAVVSMIIVSRNARRATGVQLQNIDLTRIRDLRSELAEVTSELHRTKMQITELTVQVTAANEAATGAYRQQAEMLLYARMPGVTIEDWLRHFGQAPPALTERTP
jgi:hypothetical protein